MSDATVRELGGFLMREVQKIDKSCNRILNCVEYGLCNVNLQFNEDVEAGLYPDAAKTRSGRYRKLSWEPATVWMLYKRLPREMVLNSKWEEPYPANRRLKCDLVLTLHSGVEIWIEVKLAWKSWFNCNGGYTTNNDFMFKGYLTGSHHSHSAANDFSRLNTFPPATAYKGMLLIGFDSTDAPMDNDVIELENELAIGWQSEEPFRWYDRRDSFANRCRINSWFWWHAPKSRQ